MLSNPCAGRPPPQSALQPHLTPHARLPTPAHALRPCCKPPDSPLHRCMPPQPLYNCPTCPAITCQPPPSITQLDPACAGPLQVPPSLGAAAHAVRGHGARGLCHGPAPRLHAHVQRQHAGLVAVQPGHQDRWLARNGEVHTAAGAAPRAGGAQGRACAPQQQKLRSMCCMCSACRAQRLLDLPAADEGRMRLAWCSATACVQCESLAAWSRSSGVHRAGCTELLQLSPASQRATDAPG
jgi:hypothetical protein